MKVLLTGATGFVGSNVLGYFKAKTDWEIETSKAPPIEPYDIILNMASISSVEYSIENPYEVIENNVTHTTDILEYARGHKPKLFIQFSTIETRDITNPYAASKKAQEDICLAYSKTYGIPVVVIHSTNIIGPGQSPDKFIPKLILQIQSGAIVSIYTTNGKAGTRVYNPVKNVADALLHIIRHHYEYEGYTELGIPGGAEVNNLQMAGTIADILGKIPNIEFVEAETVRPGYLHSYDPENGLDGWEPVQTLSDVLREIVK